jgi:hypothetical protein
MTAHTLENLYANSSADANFSFTEAKDMKPTWLYVCYNKYGGKLFSPFPKGLALINGTQMITSLGCEAVERASAIARQADIVAALTLEVLKGTTKAFDTGQHDSSFRLII